MSFWCGRIDQRGDGVHIGLDEGVVDDFPGITQRHGREWADGPDGGLDAGVDRRHDLPAAAVLAAQIDLVAVVRGGGIVAGRDHHPGGRVERPHRVREDRCGQPRPQPQCAPAGAGEDGHRLVGELPRSVPSVEPDHHWPSRASTVQIGHQAAAGGPYDRAVHPVGPRSEDSAQPGRTESQRLREPVGELGLAVRPLVKQSLQLRLGSRIWVVVPPRGGGRAQVSLHCHPAIVPDGR